MCSRCGELVEKALSERTHTCPCCGLVLDRDVNAAINILHREAKRFKRDSVGWGGIPSKPPSFSPGSRHIILPLRKVEFYCSAHPQKG